MALVLIGSVGLLLHWDAMQIVLAQIGFFTAKTIAETLRSAITYWRSLDSDNTRGGASWPS